MVLKRHSIQCQQWELQHLEDYKLIVDKLSKANYSKESVYIQIIKGCEMNTKNQKMDGFTRYALNGKDFMSTTWATKYWEAIHPTAKLLAEQWNSEEEKLNDHRVMSRTFCHYIIKTNLEMLSWRTASPKVNIRARGVIDSAPTSLLCHVTQFYPRDIDVTWERNGISMQNEQLRRQTLPNGDLTYQVTVEIETPHPASEYSCVVKHLSLAQELHLKWDPKHRFHLAVMILNVLFITSGLVIAYFSCRYSQVLMNTFRNCSKKYEKPKEQEKS
ncbi:rano class II histocompatibility antigen, A beta chain-like [Rhinophrynus dorsalis]